MQSIVVGDGAMGRALEAALAARGEPPLARLGRPVAGQHPPFAFSGAELAFDFSRGDAVLANLRAALDGGVRRFVIGSTAWSADRDAVGAALAERGAAAVAASSFSLGVALFGRLVEQAARLFGPYAEYDPFVVEWHRRTKSDRPSGTALELSRRLIAAHPAKTRLAPPGQTGAPAPDELDVAVVRAGSSPGMHLVGFDAPGETIELRLTARDRSAYAAGALVAADWLLAGSRPAGLHTFDEVLDAGLDVGLGTDRAAGKPAAPAPA